MPHQLDIGPRVPRRRNALWTFLGNSALRLGGWTLDLKIPDERKLIMVIAPHTSNWDFVLCMASMGTTSVDLHWLAKHTLFKGPWGGALRWLGGVAVDRTAPGGLVRQTVRTFQERESLIIAITPEGTRGRVKSWKRGFYHIAENGQIPILPIAIDYEKRTITSGPVVRASGDWDADMQQVQAFYRDVKGKFPERFTLPL